MDLEKLRGLPPEQLIELIRGMTEGEGHADEGADQQVMQPLVDAIQMLQTELESVRNELDELKTVVFDDVIGGIEGVYRDGMRSKGIEELRALASERLNPYEDRYKLLAGEDGDLYGRVYDLLEEGKDEEGYDRNGRLEQILGDITSGFDKLSGGVAAKPMAEAVPEEGALSEEEIADLVARQKAGESRGRAKE